MNTINLTNASNSLYEGIENLNQNITSLSNRQIPNLQGSLSNLNLNSSSPFYALQKKSVDTLFDQYRGELSSMKNIVSTAQRELSTASDNIEAIERQFKQMEEQHEWVNAGICKRTCRATTNLAMMPVNFAASRVNHLRNSPKSLVAGAIALTALAGFAGGFYAAKAIG